MKLIEIIICTDYREKNIMISFRNETKTVRMISDNMCTRSDLILSSLEKMA